MLPADLRIDNTMTTCTSTSHSVAQKLAQLMNTKYAQIILWPVNLSHVCSERASSKYFDVLELSMVVHKLQTINYVMCMYK